MRPSRALGSAGENLALEYLLAVGYALVERNWRCREGELDLVMQDAETIVFVEVKTRRGDELGSPEEAVTPAKQLRLAQLADQWMADHYPDGARVPDWRIDVVGVHLTRDGRLLGCNVIRSAVEG